MKNKNILYFIVCIIIVLLIIIWNYRDKIETLFLNNSNNAEYVMISSQRIGSDAKITYLDIEGKKTKVVNNDLTSAITYTYFNDKIYIASDIKKTIYELQGNNSIKKIEFDSEFPNGLSAIYCKENLLYFIQNNGFKRDGYLSTLYKKDIKGDKILYKVDLTGYISGIAELNNKVYISGVIHGENGERNGILYVVDNRTGKIEEKKIYSNYGDIKKMYVHKNDIYIQTYNTILKDEGSESDNRIAKLSDKNNIEELKIEGKELKGKILNIYDDFIIVYDEENLNLKIVNIDKKTEVFNEKIEGNIVNHCIKDNKMYFNIRKEDFNQKIICYDFDIKKITNKFDIYIENKANSNLIFPIKNN